MTELSAIQGSAPIALPTATVGADSTAKRVEFDALVLEALLKASGVLKIMDESGGEASPMPISEMMALPLARQIAEQVDLGFGSMLIRTADTGGG